MKKDSRIFQLSQKVLIRLLLGMLTGCTTVPLNHIGVFSQASAELVRSVADGYEIINHNTIEHRISEIASETGSYPSEATFKDLTPSSSLTTRIRLLTGIKSYVDALGDLASANFRKEIDAASKELYGALNELQQTYAAATKTQLPLSDNDFASIATAVDAIGTAIAEDKRRAALRTVIIQADPSIQQTMQLVSSEMPELREFSTTNKKTIFTDLIKAYQHESLALNYSERVMRLAQIRLAYEETEAMSALFTVLTASSEQIAKAHGVLRRTVEANKFTSRELISEIKELVSFAKSTQHFHDRLLFSFY